MAQYQHLRVERQIEGITERLATIVAGTIVGVEKHREPHREGHGIDLGGPRELQIRLEIG